MLKSGRQPGFTLAEVAIAVSLITIVLVGSYKLVTSSLLANNETGQKLQAYYLAAEEIENIRIIKRTSGYINIPNTITIPDINLDNVAFHRQISIVPQTDLLGIEQYKKITSSACWGNPCNNKTEVKLISYIGKDS
ncbi:MAG: prepilin-type N-terminal cleavage/methylation domain-containing protein [bacterium]|nr:prepilin-type N-terminal cleavage/methylation domain-containing protein [bacterium]